MLRTIDIRTDGTEDKVSELETGNGLFDSLKGHNTVEFKTHMQHLISFN